MPSVKRGAPASSAPLNRPGKPGDVVDALAVRRKHRAALERDDRFDLGVRVRQRKDDLSLAHPFGLDQAAHAGRRDDDVGLGHDLLQRQRLAAELAQAARIASSRRSAPTRRRTPWARSSRAMPRPAAPSPTWPTTAVRQARDRRARVALSSAGERDDGRAVLVVVQHGDVAAGARVRLRSRSTRAPRCPRAGSRRTTARSHTIVSTMRAGSFESIRIGTAVMPTSAANSAALPSMTGRPATGPMSPRPRIAVPLVTTATVFWPVGVQRGLRGVVADGEADARDAGRVDVAQDLLGRDLQRRLHVDLAALVPVEDAVRLADEPRIRQRVDARVETRACACSSISTVISQSVRPCSRRNDCRCSITSCSSAITCSTLASAPGLWNVSTR